MLNPEQEERLAVVRRIAERGKHLSESVDYTFEPSEFIDLFVHIIDELNRIKAV